MKTLNLLFLFLIITGICSNAQSTKEIVAAPEITWYGLDFSHAKLIGTMASFKDADQKSGKEIRDTYFPAWNNLIIKESDKYDLKHAFHKNSMPSDLSVSDKRNAAVDADKILSETSNTNKLSKETIDQITSHYKTGKSGVGLIFIIGDFDKIREQASVHVTFLNTSSGAVLHTEEVTGEPRGFGIKNYWAGAIFKVIEKCKKEYKSWEK